MRRYVAVLIQSAVLATGFVVILFPQARTELPHPLFWIPFFLECGSHTIRAWRAGHWQSTPDEAFTSMRTGHGRLLTGPFEGVAIVIGMIAALVLTLS